MATEKQDNVWPSPKSYFRVKIGEAEVDFQEVSGLDTEEIPSTKKSGKVTLRKGVFEKGNAFWDWFNQIEMSTIERQSVVISLLDEDGAPKIVWSLNNAWPTKITCTDMKSEGNEVAVETIEVTHESLIITNCP